jgi:hypothetical protein
MTITLIKTRMIVKIMMGLSEEIVPTTMLLRREQSKTEDIIVVGIDFFIKPIAIAIIPTAIAEIDI